MPVREGCMCIRVNPEEFEIHDRLILSAERFFDRPVD